MATTDAKSPAPGRVAANSSNGGSSGSYDAIVVGGGHNGLTTAAYLAKAGQRVLVLERRHILGGACVTEELWPGRRVSRASYVVSMLQPRIVKDLRLEDFGYHAVPLDPAYAALTPDGPVVFYDDPQRHRRLDPPDQRRTTPTTSSPSKSASSASPTSSPRC